GGSAHYNWLVHQKHLYAHTNFTPQVRAFSVHHRLVGFLRILAITSFTISALSAAAQAYPPPQLEIASGWQLQDSAKVTETGAILSTEKANTRDWHTAVVPGTVLTALIANKTYPEALYGENNRPEVIPESLNKTPYWYRTVVTIP